jgi:RecB family exonuclease
MLAAVARVTLVTGGLASGKTEALVAAAAEQYRLDPFSSVQVLVPTARHADQFRRRLSAACGAAFNLRVETIGQHAGARLAAAGRPPLSREAAAALLRTVFEGLAGRGEVPHLAPLAGTRGGLRLLGTALEELIAEDVDFGSFAGAARATGDSCLMALARVAVDYRGALEERGWVHPAAAAGAAAAVGAGEGPRLLLVDGFQFLRAGEARLVAAMAGEAGEALIAIDPGAGGRAGPTLEALRATFPGAVEREVAFAAPAPALARGEAVDREEQVRAVAHRVKELLAEDPALRPSAIAVGARQVAPYARLARQVFGEYDIPLDTAAAEPLAMRPPGSWLLRLLRLGRNGWRLRDLLPVLRSGYCDSRRWILEGELGRAAREARRARIWGGRDMAERIATALEQPAAPDTPVDEFGRRAAEGMRAALTALAELVDRPEASVAAHASAIDAALFGPRGIVPPALRDGLETRSEIEALRRTLLALQATDDLVGGPAVPFEEFAGQLEAAMEAPSVQLREAGGVLLAPLHTLHGLRFEHVLVMGLIEGEFPAPQARFGLLDDRARALLAEAGLALPPPARSTERELWRSALTRASGSFTGWCTKVDGRGRPAAPSTFYGELPGAARRRPALTEPAVAASRRELAMACARGWERGGVHRPGALESWEVVRRAVPVEHGRRSFGNAAAFEGMPGAAGGPYLDPGRPWSASRFESYRTCPFQFYGKYVLHLDEVDQEQDEADAAMRGHIVHAILEDAIRPLAERRLALDRESLAEAVERLRSNGPRIWNEAPATHGFGRAALWRLQGVRVIEDLVALLRREADASSKRGVQRVHGVEVRLEELGGSAGLPVALAGAIDRVDVGDDFVVVVDYKSGREIKKKEVAEAELLQLQLYGEVARAALGKQHIVGRYAILRHKDVEFDTRDRADRGIVRDGLAVAAEIVGLVDAGKFGVHPRPATCPKHCAFKNGCRVNQYSRYKWEPGP